MKQTPPKKKKRIITRSRKRGSKSAEREPLTLLWNSQQIFLDCFLTKVLKGRPEDWGNNKWNGYVVVVYNFEFERKWVMLLVGF